ncbi:succinate dehydrogenase, cytochrome b556 subunit [Wenxinia marina]|uniref:Succinate dehydrogenase cytochrome b556 subunit n=1 Tax=Wenxinia marina DSM 24838 TaxID=1123501 RepID=A0A0D0Q7Q4_9RHOB|nr:succinate dehydrogenase, cytochrome b556 subunit [Wenxinia marina]KIQ70499.1 succinate dehydrogenase subunit C [Wenxinia marina DSM 24838]GGL52638.1 succinate dehydrogenase, cytochrome b556 subunit [Wenxinia marina]
MADVNRGNRPLSPFMIGPYYRPQWTSMTSIFTRITGNGLIVAAALTVWWFLAAAAGPDAYRVANGVITSWFGDIVMTLSVAALWYHTLAGIRHLIWDTGRMLEVGRAERLGQAAVAGAVILTILTVLIV